jgi:hypothetical protein
MPRSMLAGVREAWDEATHDRLAGMPLVLGRRR